MLYKIDSLLKQCENLKRNQYENDIKRSENTGLSFYTSGRKITRSMNRST